MLRGRIPPPRWYPEHPQTLGDHLRKTRLDRGLWQEHVAAELGVSFAEYVRRLIAQDLGPARAAVDISVVFNLVDEGPPTNVARNKDKMVAEAVWEEHRRSTGKTRQARLRVRAADD